MNFTERYWTLQKTSAIRPSSNDLFVWILPKCSLTEPQVHRDWKNVNMNCRSYIIESFTTEVCFRTFVTQMIKLYNFSNISGRSIIQIVLGSLSKIKKTILIYTERLTLLEILVVPRDLKKMNFLPRDLPLSKFQIWNLEIFSFEKTKCVPHLVWQLKIHFCHYHSSQNE